MGTPKDYGQIVKAVQCTITLADNNSFVCEVALYLTNKGNCLWYRYDNQLHRLKLPATNGLWSLTEGFLSFTTRDSIIPFLIFFDVPGNFMNVTCGKPWSGEGKFYDFEPVNYLLWFGCA